MEEGKLAPGESERAQGEEESRIVRGIEEKLIQIVGRGLSPQEVQAIVFSRRWAGWNFREEGEGKQATRVMELTTDKGSLVYTSGYEATQPTVAITSPSLEPKEISVLGITSIGITNDSVFVMSFKCLPEAEGEKAERRDVFIDQEGAFSVSPSEGL